MGLIFRKRIKLLPGVHVNLGKRGTSISFGVRGASVTYGKGRRTTSVGIPGSGLRYVDTRRTAQTQQVVYDVAPRRRPLVRKGLIIALLLLIAAFLIGRQFVGS